MRNDWVIVGGGLHGIHLAVRLIGEAGIPRERLRIVDEHEHLLQRWRECTGATGMKYLRSPAVHHLDLNPWSLIRFAMRQKGPKHGQFAQPYERPSLSLFNKHCEHIIKRFRLNDLHVRARAVGCSITCDEVRILLSDGSDMTSQNIALAMGNSEQTDWPEWAPDNDHRVQHVFDVNLDTWASSEETIAVVGGGISAGQVALRLVNAGHKVHLISRHALREHHFDSDPGWLGPKNMTGFAKVNSLDERREIITQARHKGSVPPDVLTDLKDAIGAEKLHWHEAQIDKVDTSSTSLVHLRLATGEILSTQRMLLATGFATHRPGGSLVDDMISSLDLPCSACGYPVVDNELRWHPRVFVAGPLAELELGPASRNISGARRAGERLVKAIKSRQHEAEEAA